MTNYQLPTGTQPLDKITSNLLISNLRSQGVNESEINQIMGQARSTGAAASYGATNLPNIPKEKLMLGIVKGTSPTFGITGYTPGMKTGTLLIATLLGLGSGAAILSQWNVEVQNQQWVKILTTVTLSASILYFIMLFITAAKTPTTV